MLDIFILLSYLRQLQKLILAANKHVIWIFV